MKPKRPAKRATKESIRRAYPAFRRPLRPGTVIAIPAMELHIVYREGDDFSAFLGKAMAFFGVELTGMALRGQLPEIEGHPLFTQKKGDNSD